MPFPTGVNILLMSQYANTAGHTKKTAVYCISYIGYCVGNLIGPQAFKANEAPKYTSGVAAMLSCYAISLVLIGLVRDYTESSLQTSLLI
jgi:ACS family allantoate permease-like MFS transporter